LPHFRHFVLNILLPVAAILSSTIHSTPSPSDLALV
jgi:hypothetical protein